jgi:hypothetical protein
MGCTSSFPAYRFEVIALTRPKSNVRVIWSQFIRQRPCRPHGLVFDNGGPPLPERRGLVHLAQGRAVRVSDCEIVNAGRNGIALEAMEGEVTGNTIAAAEVVIFSLEYPALATAASWSGAVPPVMTAR